MAASVLRDLSALDVALFALAVLLAFVLYRAALSAAGRLACTLRATYLLWLAGATLALGAGLWALAVTVVLPLTPEGLVPYAVRPGLPALALAIVGSCAALMALDLPLPAWGRAAIGGALLGLAATLLLYLDLDALGWPAALAADPLLGAQAGGISILAAILLVRTASGEARSPRRQRWWELLGSVVAVGSVPAAFYLAAVATGGDAPRPPRPASLVLPLEPPVAVAIGCGALVLLAALMLAANMDRRIRDHEQETVTLRRSEDRFHSLMEASAQIVWTTAPNGEMEGDQPSWSQFTGQELTGYRGWGWFNAIHPEDREATAGVWQESLANRRSVEVEHRVRRHDGLYRDCVARMVPVLEPDGSVREWIGTHTDVTERARMQEERELLAGAGRVLSSSLDERETLGAIAGLLVPRVADWCAIDLRSAEGRIERVVATHEDPHLSTLLMRIELDFSQATPEHGIARVLSTGESEMIREVTPELLRAMAADDENYRRLNDVGVSSLISVPLVARDQVLGVLTLALARGVDPYDLRDLALAEELARRSAIAIDNARLYSAAREAIQARDEMMSIVSHDLRNPLSTVVMTADLMLDPERSDADPQRQLEMIRRAAASMNRLIQDLLDVSQTESGSLAIAPEPVDPGDLAREACEAMIPLAAEKGQRLTCDIEPALPAVEADANRINQVLSNLIGNAIKFVGEDGAIALHVSGWEDWVRFSVHDSGPGIPREDLERVFDRHWRAKETAHLGAGLGLAISRAIVQAHGGEIWAESEPGIGTRFHFTLPALERRAREDRRERAGAAEESVVAER